MHFCASKKGGKKKEYLAAIARRVCRIRGMRPCVLVRVERDELVRVERDEFVRAERDEFVRAERDEWGRQERTDATAALPSVAAGVAAVAAAEARVERDECGRQRTPQMRRRHRRLRPHTLVA